MEKIKKDMGFELIDEKLTMTLVKTREYKLQPYGKFALKFKTKKNYLPNIIPLFELDILHETSYPLTSEQEKVVIKLMKKTKTDVLTDGEKYYTRTNGGITEISHTKLHKYKYDESFKELVDDGHSF